MRFKQGDEIFSVEATIQRDIQLAMVEVLMEYETRYRHKPKALCLGPEEFVNWETSMRESSRQMLYAEVEKSEFRGVQIFVGPINGIIPLGNGRQELYPIIEEKRRRLTGLN